MIAHHLQIVTPTDGRGQNCADRALAALMRLPDHRAVIGSLLLRGCRCLRTGCTLEWVKPWHHHIWLIEPDGAYYDPSACNLEHWARIEEVGLPRPWQEMTPGVLESPQQQMQLVKQASSGRPSEDHLPDALYLPGLVYRSDVEEKPPSHAYVSAWGKLARQSVQAGGWDLAQLQLALGQVDDLLKQPSRTGKITRPQRQAATGGRGFGSRKNTRNLQP